MEDRPSIPDVIESSLRDKGAPMTASELEAAVAIVLGDASGRATGPELRRMENGGRLVQDRKRGPYRLPTKGETIRAAGVGSRSGVGSLRVIQGDEKPGPGEYVYPFLEGGPSAGFPARAMEAAEQYVIAPRDVVAGWTGGRVPLAREAYWTKIRGTSMEPWLPDGSPVFVAICDRVIDGGRYVIYLDDDDAEVVKRIERIGGGILRLISDNPSHSTRTLRFVEDDVYEDAEYRVKVRIRVRGVVLYPSDTAHAMVEIITNRLGHQSRT